MDDCDRASEAEEKFREKALRAARDRSGARYEIMEACIECGDDIPEERRLAGVGAIRCVRCQELFERAIRRRA